MSKSIGIITYLLTDYKDLKILALTNNVNFLKGTELLQAGVQGYGNAYMHPTLLVQAIEVIISNNVWIYPELAQHLIKNITKQSLQTEQKDTKLNQLTQHEKECAILVSEGNSNKEIASLLNLQEITIKKHLSSVYKKLSIKNRIELAIFLN
ncbi:response regulator transcription factor [Sulfurimonas sp.]|nr:response regulator transcription factor [Sulfurimonas sp.]